MRSIIVFILSNYALSFLILGFIASGIVVLREPKRRDIAVEALLSYYLLFAIGLCFLYNFIMHVFFQGMASRFIGWAPSPFETEVGTASLGYAVVALLAFKGSYGLRVGAIIGPSIFTLGAAAGHIHQMVTAHNFSSGNAGPVFYTDIIVPLIGFALLRMARPQHAALRPVSHALQT